MGPGIQDSGRTLSGSGVKAEGSGSRCGSNTSAPASASTSSPRPTRGYTRGHQPSGPAPPGWPPLLLVHHGQPRPGRPPQEQPHLLRVTHPLAHTVAGPNLLPTRVVEAAKKGMGPSWPPLFGVHPGPPQPAVPSPSVGTHSLSRLLLANRETHPFCPLPCQWSVARPWRMLGAWNS